HCRFRCRTPNSTCALTGAVSDRLIASRIATVEMLSKEASTAFAAPMKHKELSIAIIGGGIGGLTAALSLLRAGLDVHVYERAKKLGEVGAGIQVSPNASRILHGFGLADALASMGVKPLAMHQRRWDDGRTLLPLCLRASLGNPRAVAATSSSVRPTN